jgi:hypothetical protein
MSARPDEAIPAAGINYFCEGKNPMRRGLAGLLLTMLLMAALSLAVYAQGPSTSLSGVVVDQSGGVIPGADVTVKSESTGTEFKTVTADNGTFSIPALAPGTYTATVTVPNFKQAVYRDIKLIASTPASIRVTLQVGGSSETVVVQAGAEMVQSQSANITTTLVSSQITNLPLATRNVMDIIAGLPGVSTTASVRNSTINGLPSVTINITVDGVNTQDNFNKNGDGFFSYISPRLDAMEEVTVSTATPGAESAGSGAVQIKFVTRSGNNNYRGSLYWYHRDPSLNANYWFNNRDRAALYKGDTGKWQPCTAAQLQNEWDQCKAGHDRYLVNQFGGRVGGPIAIPGLFNGQDRAFFFVNYEEFRLPNQMTRTKTLYNPATETGIFRYTAAGATQQVNLLTLAAGKGFTSTIDPTIKNVLATVRASTSQGTLNDQTDPNYQYFYFTNGGAQRRTYPTVRLDFNLTSKHKLETSWNYSTYNSSPDFLNSADVAFPGSGNFGTQTGPRFQFSTALRSTITPRLVNEARVGITGGSTLWYANVNKDMFTWMDGFIWNLSGVSNPYVVRQTQRRSTPTENIDDTMSWTKGAHSISFGGSWSNIGSFFYNQLYVPSIGFGLDNTNDPARILFDATNGPTNFPGASSTQISAAGNIYASLTGRITSINGAAYLNESSLKYTYMGSTIRRSHQREAAFFVTDAWRVRPNLTLNYGLRWELQFPWVPLNEVFSWATPDEVWGLSGANSIFKPGATGGKTTQYYKYEKGSPAYNMSYKNFAPSLGFAWTPRFSGSFLNRIFGDAKTVFRGGFSLAYNRPSMGDYDGVFSSNPGGSITTNRSQSLGNLILPGESWPLLFQEKSRLGAPAFAETPNYPLQPTIDNSVRAFDPNFRTPYTMSWTFGLQREITRDTVFEVRYVANRNLQRFTGINLNERNIVENGLLAEFKLAQQNLQINIASNRGNTFKYAGPGTGTSALPITLAYFSGVPNVQAGDATKYTSSNFGSSTFVNTLATTNANPHNYANNLYNDSGRRTNALNAGLPANLFLVNPAVMTGGAYIYTNGGFDYYDSMQMELRRRMAHGLLLQVNYTWSKALSSERVSFRTPYFKQLASQIPHTLKANWLYELPFGRGRALLADIGTVTDRFIGGWEFQGTARIQQGIWYDAGNVRLVGMTDQELRDEVAIRFDDAKKIVYYLPQDIITNTIAAFNTSATTSTGYSTGFGVPAGRYFAPANSGGCVGVATTQWECAPLHYYVSGPRFVRFDLSLVKRIRFTETRNFELRGEFLNAFNNINFTGQLNPTTSNVQTWGQVSSAYRDLNQAQDPGGRLVQIVLRLNF